MKEVLDKITKKQAHENETNFGKILIHFIAFQTQILQTNANKIHFSSFVLIMLFHILEQTDTVLQKKGL